MAACTTGPFELLLLVAVEAERVAPCAQRRHGRAQMRSMARQALRTTLEGSVDVLPSHPATLGVTAHAQFGALLLELGIPLRDVDDVHSPRENGRCFAGSRKPFAPFACTCGS